MRFHNILLFLYNYYFSGNAFQLKEFIKLTRFQKTVIPTTFLTIVGGAVTNPHTWQTWIHSPPFIASMAMTHILTSGSMIINDLFDIEADRINNPSRPLVQETITQKEAIIATITLFGIYCQIGNRYIDPRIFPIWSSSLVLVIIYTPFLKKICIIKNITVATVVAMTIPFLGWSTMNPTDIVLSNSPWMWQTTRIVFVASLYNELLLDISDKIGDAVADIPTIPVIFGKYRTVQFLLGILIISELYNVQNLLSSTVNEKNVMFLAVVITYIPLYRNLLHIYNNDYQRKYIQSAISNSSFSLLIYLLIEIVSKTT